MTEDLNLMEGELDTAQNLDDENVGQYIRNRLLRQQAVFRDVSPLCSPERSLLTEQSSRRAGGGFNPDPSGRVFQV